VARLVEGRRTGVSLFGGGLFLWRGRGVGSFMVCRGLVQAVGWGGGKGEDEKEEEGEGDGDCDGIGRAGGGGEGVDGDGVRDEDLFHGNGLAARGLRCFKAGTDGLGFRVLGTRCASTDGTGAREEGGRSGGGVGEVDEEHHDGPRRRGWVFGSLRGEIKHAWCRSRRARAE